MFCCRSCAHGISLIESISYEILLELSRLIALHPRRLHHASSDDFPRDSRLSADAEGQSPEVGFGKYSQPYSRRSRSTNLLDYFCLDRTVEEPTIDSDDRARERFDAAGFLPRSRAMIFADSSSSSPLSSGTIQRMAPSGQ